MSEENKVTTVEKSVKAKDPRKVELGKRLAKISREAKERKARQRSEVENKQSPEENREITNYIDFEPSALRYLIGGVGVVAALGGLYFAYKKDKRESKQSDRPEVQQQREEKDIDQRSQQRSCSEAAAKLTS